MKSNDILTEPQETREYLRCKKKGKHMYDQINIGGYIRRVCVKCGYIPKLIEKI